MDMIETDPALVNATIQDPACIKGGDACPAFKAAHDLSQKEVSFYHQFDYGHYVSWYLLATLGLFTLAFVYRKWVEGKRASSVRTSSNGMENGWTRKLKASVRYVSYRRVPGKVSDKLGMPTAGITTLILLFTLYCLVLTFAVRPYYRAHRGYGSPPLAVRTGLMATALTPWIVALSGKANLITMLTGIGHERLNVVHRWIARICLGLSVVHTVPFLIAPAKEGGYAALHKQFYEPGGYEVNTPVWKTFTKLTRIGSIPACHPWQCFSVSWRFPSLGSATTSTSHSTTRIFSSPLPTLGFCSGIPITWKIPGLICGSASLSGSSPPSSAPCGSTDR